MSDRLGAPLETIGFQHGSAGSVNTGCRIDCWVKPGLHGLTEMRFEVFAAHPTIEAAEWLAEWLTGRTLEDAKRVTGLWLAEALEMPAESRGDALYIEDALRMALGGGK